jgi:hypothetical protein
MASDRSDLAEFSRRTVVEVSRRVRADAQRVFAELADGWAYVGWVVGATHIRDVEAGWPATGTRIHHMVGCWPLAVADHTESLVSEPPHRLVLKARGWPLGEAVVEITARDRPDGGCLVSIRETPAAGPGRWLDGPPLRWILGIRNRETLRRLADRVEHRRITGTGGAQPALDVFGSAAPPATE